MENINERLCSIKRAYAEIHLDRMRRNLQKISAHLPKDRDWNIMAVVKANAYGHDDKAVAKMLQDNGIKFFGVSNLHEAKRLRNCGILGNILILGYTDAEFVDEMETYDVTCTIVSWEHAKELSKKCVGSDKKIRCHIAIDTGMGRIGLPCFGADDIDDPIHCAQTVNDMCNLPGLEVEGMFTHFAVADSNADVEGDRLYTAQQIAQFETLHRTLSQTHGISLQYCHIANSAATGSGVADNTTVSTLYRVGIILYGINPSMEMELPFELEPVMDLKAEISMVKQIPAGRFVSYGRHWKSETDTRIATVTIGYADGLPRLLSGRASLIVNGQPAPIVGNICMDQLMIDVTEIPDVKVGNTVTILGRDGRYSITANELANIYGSIGYELVCGVSSRVPRVIMDNGDIIKIQPYL